MNLLQALRGQPSGSVQPARSIGSIDDYLLALNSFGFNGIGYSTLEPLAEVATTLGGEKAERIGGDFVGLATAAQRSNGVVFACMLVRQLVFSAIRFQYQRFNRGRPSELWGDPSLLLLERPWPGGTTQDLLARMIQDADLAGNGYVIKDTPLPRLGGDEQAELVRLRPDWVEIVLRKRWIEGGHVGYRRIGYLYTEGGPDAGDPVPFLASEVAHFAPTPDPLASYRGMSWLTPVVREVEADGLMTRHKRKFFENGATPNLIFKYPPETLAEKVKAFRELMTVQHAGLDNAYKQLHVGGGADPIVVGANLEQVDFKVVQGAGETRVCAAAGVPVVIVGLSEGLQGSSLNAGNYGQARRRLADAAEHPLWANAAGSLQGIVPVQDGSRLYYDARDVPFLREDSKDASEIAEQQARTVRAYVDAGFTPDSAVATVETGDLRLLEHTGLFSVQLQPAGGAGSDADGGTGDDTAGSDAEQARAAAELLQKAYLAVGVVIDAEEARELARRAGANLPAELPTSLAPAAPAPAPEGDTDGE